MISKSLVGFGLAVAALFAPVSPANATALLYRNDFASGLDYLGAAINASGFAVTSTSGDLSPYNLGHFDIVVYANQNDSIPDGDIDRLNNYVAGGGRVIFDDWTMSNGFNGGEFFTGNSNLNTLTLGPQFRAGIASPLAVTNPGWLIFSTGLGLLGGVSSGTFENGDDAIVVSNAGRIIVNGFLSDTVASQRLYANELASLSVPEPSTFAVLLTGLAGLRALRRRRKTA